MRYIEYRFYSPGADCVSARISIAGEQTREYFAIIRADEPGSRYRKRRQKACEAIAEAIERGDEPGEVAIDHDAADSAIDTEIARERALT